MNLALSNTHPLRSLLALSCILGYVLGLWMPRIAVSADGATDAIAVKVTIQGEVVLVDVDYSLKATPREVWEVLTDFEHLPLFIANIRSSRILSRVGNVVRVAQTGKTSFGPLSFEFQSERELTLSPYDGFESRMISGNMKRFHGTTRLEAIEGGTRLHYHSEAVPDTAIPLGLGRALIEAETREHYQDIRREVLKRKALAPQ